MVNNLEKYLVDKLLKYSIKENNLSINNMILEIVDEDELLFDSEFNFLPLSNNFNSDGWVYEFGGRWYYQIKDSPVSLSELIYLGECNQKLPTKSFIGVHSGNEILNGVGMYDTWIEKSKFLGIENLGICEKHTLSGIMSFQKKCNSNNIKPITGITLSVKNKHQEYEIKAFAKNFQGWQNLLLFSSIINLEEKTHIDEKSIEENSDGLFLIIDPKYCDFENKPNFINLYQLDTVVFEDYDKDKEYLDNLEKYITSDLNPILLNDAYYCEKEEWVVREKLWGISKSFDYKTKNQYFKNSDQIASELIKMFEKNNSSWIKLYKDSLSNLNNLVDDCNFIYDTTSRHLPQYEMTFEEKEQFKSNEELFLYLIKKGLKDKGLPNSKMYIDRLKEEIYVLKKGNVIDYFLILHDIIKFAKDKNILVGLGRGSAGGSLISYLLGIIQINPMEFNLLFARFLNIGRIGELKKCDAYEIETTNGVIKLNEKSLIRVLRNGKEEVLFVEDLKINDEIIKY